jgi:hypothetical protein
MPRRKPAPAASRHLRRAIASAAARLMAEDGSSDYAAAKRKAARSLGAENGEALPTNEEVQTELRAYQALYQEATQPMHLHALRQTAVDAMQLLDEFQPRLTGAVLDGTAGSHSPIRLLLFADSSKDVEIWLLSNNIAFKPAAATKKMPSGAEDQLILDFDETTVLLDIYPPNSRRGQLTTQSMAREAVQTLLEPPLPPAMPSLDHDSP